MEILDNRYNSKTGFVRLYVGLKRDNELNIDSYEKQLDYKVGSTIIIKAQEKDGFDFCYFYNPVKKQIITKQKEYFFVITEDTFLYIVYRKLSEKEMNKRYDVYNFIAPLVKDDNYNVKIDKNFVDYLDESQSNKDIPSSKAIMDLIDKLHDKVDNEWITFTDTDKEKIDRAFTNVSVLQDIINQLQDKIDSGNNEYNERIQELQNLINDNFNSDIESKSSLLKRINELKTAVRKNTEQDKISYNSLNTKIDNIPILEEEDENIIFVPTDNEQSDW